jgi:nucleotide-binding universal stress UspA family protein
MPLKEMENGMKNILAALDFSNAIQPVLDRAKELALLSGGRLWLVHVAAPEPDFVGYDSGPAGTRDRVAKHHREEHREIQSNAERLRESGIDATALLIQGATVEVILRESKKLDVDLIVIGSHGHGAVYRALLGSTSEGVLHGSDVPVLIVPVRH